MKGVAHIYYVSVLLAARPVLVDEGLDESDEFLSVTLMVNPLCREGKYPVLVTFGAQENDNGTCQGQQNATMMSLASGESVTFSVDRNTVTLRENEEYCYIIRINGTAGKHIILPIKNSCTVLICWVPINTYEANNASVYIYM